jgi:glutamine---fructose-6-phosphate transaminase (isomerizing)
MCGLVGLVTQRDYVSSFNFEQFLSTEALAASVNQLEQLTRLKTGVGLYQLAGQDNWVERLKRWLALEPQGAASTDALWIVEHDLPNLLKRVTDAAEARQSGAPSPWVFKFEQMLELTMRSIDARMETRGRDSLGLSIVFHTETPPLLAAPLMQSDGARWVWSGPVAGGWSTAFVYKVAQESGRLGENGAAIRRLVAADQDVTRIVVEGEYQTLSLSAHTRWASVGAVTVKNCHPVADSGPRNGQSPPVLSSMNGDVHNHAELLRQLYGEPDPEWPTCDTFAAAALLRHNGTTDAGLAQSVSQMRGSFVILSADCANPKELVVIKQGANGLFIGDSPEGQIVSSDVLGLIDWSVAARAIDDSAVLRVRSRFPYLVVSGHGPVPEQDAQRLRITPRDVDLGGFEHFLAKEIAQSPDAVRESLSLRRQSDARSAFSEGEVPPHFRARLAEGRLRQLIFTGMGTCWTAGLAIAHHARRRFRERGLALEVKAPIASEASLYHLDDDMSDCLVVVVAQSGSTIDTNTYARQARARGAATLALANKHGGDVTRIVEGVIYLGAGRSVEIAVPSTKVYFAHLAVGTRLVEAVADWAAGGFAEKLERWAS